MPQTPPAQLSGGSWCASVGPKERRSGEGRCALGEKAFSSDPRGSLGVPDPPAAAPPECAVATVATARARGQNPPPWGRGVMGAPAPRWGRVLLVAYCGPRLPPLSWGRVPLGPAGCPASGELCVCCVVRSRPRGVSPGGRGGALGCDCLVGPGSPSPAAVVRRSLLCPPSPLSRSRWRCGGPGLGRPRSRVCPQDVEPRGQT